MTPSQQAAMNAERLYTLHRVGETLKSTYKVKEICSEEKGIASYKCERLTDGVEILIDCLSLGNMEPPNRQDLFAQSKKEMLNAKKRNKPSVYESFEGYIHGDVRFYVVRHAIPQPQDDCIQSILDLENGLQPQLRRSPRGAPCVFYRRGNCHLEIDVPAEGCAWWSCLTLFLIPIAVPLFGIYYLVQGAIEGSLLKVLISSVAVVGYIPLLAFVMYFLARFIFGHNNLIITPTYFRNKTTLEIKPQFRDSVEHPEEAAGALGCTDRIFCKQIRGRTDEIVTAALEDPTGYKRPDGTLVLLMNNGDKHILYFHLSYDQKKWIVQEINAVLANIRYRMQTA